MALVTKFIGERMMLPDQLPPINLFLRSVWGRFKNRFRIKESGLTMGIIVSRPKYASLRQFFRRDAYSYMQSVIHTFSPF